MSVEHDALNIPFGLRGRILEFVWSSSRWSWRNWSFDSAADFWVLFPFMDIVLSEPTTGGRMRPGTIAAVLER